MSPIRNLAVRQFTIGGLKRRKASECQDAAIAIRNGDDATALVVADGLGQSRHGGVGARLAVWSIARVLLDSHPPDLLALAEALGEARGDWLHSIERDGRGPASSYATTFAACLIQDASMLLASVGDCFAVVERERDSNKPYLVLDQGAKGEFAGATPTWSQANWKSHLRVRLLRDSGITGVLLSTDGLEDASIEFRKSDSREWGRGQSPVVWGVQLGTIDVLLRRARDTTSRDIARALASNREITSLKGDDIGVSIACW